MDPTAIQGVVKVGLDKADLRQREPVGTEHWGHFWAWGKRKPQVAGLRPGQMVTSLPWGQVCAGEDRGPGCQALLG